MADFTTPRALPRNDPVGPAATAAASCSSGSATAARDPIEELVARALEFERSETASLDRFLAWFARGDVEIKRDPVGAGDAVRVMTVHGAKGLEAPVVILADATADPAQARRAQPASLDLPIGGRGTVPLLRPRKDELRRAVRRAHRRRASSATCEEHWRLLYVALTRAERAAGRRRGPAASAAIAER